MTDVADSYALIRFCINREVAVDVGCNGSFGTFKFDQGTYKRFALRVGNGSFN